MNKETEKLDTLVGKTVMYHTNNIKILSYRKVDNKVTIVTDKKWLEFNNGDLGKFLDDVRDVEEESALTVNHKVPLRTIDAMNDLKDILMDNIEKVKQDREYVPQGKAVNDSAKSIIELAKTEIEAMKLIKGE